jgi:hypothetical protein
MSSHIQCVCGNLANWAADPDMPYDYDAVADTYSFRLSDNAIVLDAYCHFCGGRVVRRGAPKCRCGFLDHCHKQGEPVDLENIFLLRATYQGEEIRFAVWFCPSCGCRA